MAVIDRLNAEHGELPDQGSINAQGNEYLDVNFPRLSSIVALRRVGSVEAAPAFAPADDLQIGVSK
jgi:hypothetical protein